MANKFKFGDMVEYEGFGICVVTEVTEHFLTIRNEKGQFNAIANPERAKLIPHPDTVRLEYMGKLVAESMGMKYDPVEHRRQIDESMEGYDA